MKIFLSAIWLFLTINMLGQNETINYIDFHKRFAIIEELIVNEEFHRAEDSILNLFNDFDPPFLREIIIALQITALNKSFNYTADLIELAFEKGAELHCIEQKPILREFIKTKKWREIKANYSNHREFYYSSIDTILRNDFRTRSECELVSRGTDSIISIVERNYNNIVKIIKERGHFPGEKMIGVRIEGDHNSKTCSYQNYMVVTTLLHYQLSFSNLEKELERALREGYLHPQFFAYIFDFQKKFAEKKNYNRISKSSYFKKPILPDYEFNKVDPQSKYLIKVNADRFEIGLCTYEVERKKTAIDNKYNIELDYIF